MEGQGFRDRAPQFEQAGIAVVGVSFDPPERNKGFIDKWGFPFRLLSDVDRSVGEHGDRIARDRERANGSRDGEMTDERAVVRRVADLDVPQRRVRLGVVAEVAWAVPLRVS